MVTLTGSPFKANQLKAETGKIVHFWLLVEGSRLRRSAMVVSSKRIGNNLKGFYDLNLKAKA